MEHRTEPPVGADLITRTTLLERGFSRDEIDTDRRSGELLVIRRGVYSAAGFAELGADQQHAVRARAAVVAAPSLVVSHVSAAVLHGLPVRAAALRRVHLTRPGTSGGRSQPDRVLHVGRLTEAEIVEINGTATTSVARTLSDLARSEPFEAGVMVADAALHREPELVSSVVEALARSRHQRGAAGARRSLFFADGRSESVGESRLRVFCRVAGLPVPDLQCRVRDGSGCVVARTDFAYSEGGLLVEFDGMIKYGALLRDGRTPAQALQAEKAREDALRELGWQVLRVIWADLRDPERLAARFTAAIQRGSRAASANIIVGSIESLPPIRLPR